MRYRIGSDGSFDLFANGVTVEKAYPSVDGTPLRPLKAVAAQDSVCYTLKDGTLTLRFVMEGETLALHTEVEGLANAHDIMPVASGKPVGMDRAFVQGIGMGGPSGFRKLEKEVYASHSLIAVGSADTCMVFYAREQSRLHCNGRVSEEGVCFGFDTECLPLNETELPVLYIREGDDYSALLRSCAKEIAETMHARPVNKPAFHWCSWYYLYHTLDQETLEEYLEGFRQHRAIAPFSHIQIDAGYFRSCGDWLQEYDRFPKGLKHAADTIRAAGYEPGIWIGPFMVGDNSILLREHPDWMLKWKDGTYVHPWIQFNEPKPWGYRDSLYYTLDTSNPEAMEYLRNVFTTLRSWGYTLFKTDFMFWGLWDSSKVIRHTPGKTSFEYFRDVLTMIRESIGEESRWLGCIAPFIPAIGFVDMMRIAGDVGAQWDENGFGPANMLQELTADQYFNNIYWQNDPDAIMLRDFHIHLTPPQIEGLAILAAMSGGTIYTSDPLHLIGQDRLDLLEFIRPNGIHNAQYPMWADMRDEAVLVQTLKTRKLVYFFNRTGHEVMEAFDWNRLLGGEYRYLRMYHGVCRPIEEVPYVRIPAKGGVLFFATNEPLDVDPRNIWDE